MLTQDVILGIIASTAMLCFTLSIASMLLAARRLASSNVVKVVAEMEAEKAAGKAAETEAAGAEVTKEASAEAVASEEEDASKRGKR